MLAIYPLFTWLTALTSKRWQKLEKAKNLEFDIAGGRFAEVIGQIRVVKSFVAEPRELAHFNGRYDSTIGITREQSAYWHRMDVARRGALNVIFFFIYVQVDVIQSASFLFCKISLYFLPLFFFLFFFLFKNNKQKNN